MLLFSTKAINICPPKSQKLVAEPITTHSTCKHFFPAFFRRYTGQTCAAGIGALSNQHLDRHLRLYRISRRPHTSAAKLSGRSRVSSSLPITHRFLMRVISENCEHCTRICVGLLKRARESTPAVLGFDIEWSVRPSEPRRQVSLLQLSARDGYTVLFHLKYDERRPGIMPKALKELLVNDTVQLVSLVYCFKARSVTRKRTIRPDDVNNIKESRDAS